MRKFMGKAVAVLLAVLVLPAPVLANLINFDVQPSTTRGYYTGTGLLGGGTWNYSNATTVNNLLDSTGAASGVNFSYNRGGSADSGLQSSSLTGTQANFLLGDYAWANSDGGMTMTLTGLQANTDYDLVVFATTPDNNQGTLFGGALSGTVSGAQVSSFAAGVNYVRQTVRSSATGTIQWTMVKNTAAGSGFAGFNGFQIVPEPGMLAGLGVGSLALSLAVRRRLLATKPVR